MLHAHQSTLRVRHSSARMARHASWLLGLCLLSPPASSDSGPRFELGVFAEQHGITETRGSRHLVDERGIIPAAEARVIIPLPAGTFAMEHAASGGALHYDGQTQSGRPFQTTTDQRISRSAIKYSAPLTEDLHIRLGWELEARSRRIQGRDPVLGLDEDYRHQLALAGFQYQGSWGLAQADLLTSLRGSQSVSSRGAIDKVTLPSDHVLGIRLQAVLPLTDPGPTTRLYWVPRLEYLHTPRSTSRPYSQGGLPAGTISQPETRRWSAGLGLVLSW